MANNEEKEKFRKVSSTFAYDLNIKQVRSSNIFTMCYLIQQQKLDTKFIASLNYCHFT